MKLLTLTLKNFRNHKNLDLSFEGESYLITGPNGSGKSNILEAINLLATTKSLRARYDKDMIAWDEPFAKVSGKVQLSTDTADTTLLELNIITDQAETNRSKKTFKVNTGQRSATKFAGNFLSVLFTPTDIDLLTGAPAQRRKYFDQVLVQTTNDYKKSSHAYEKIIRQKNALLAQDFYTTAAHTQLDYWNTKLTEEAEVIQLHRLDYITFLTKQIGKYHTALETTLASYDLTYYKSDASSQHLTVMLDREKQAHRSLVGPHRDDFKLFAQTKDLGSFGSRGQQRTALLALKMCELDYIEQKRGIRPILLLDDIYSELDPKHKAAINQIIDQQQTIITTAHDAFDGVELARLH